jgi:hypothetical protein
VAELNKDEHPDTDLHRAGCTHCQYLYDSKKLPDIIPFVFDASETATILAALRLFQRTYEGCDSGAIARDFPEHFEEGMQSVEPWPLGSEDIDTLCERINCREDSKLRAALLAVLPNVPGWNTQDFAGRPWLVLAKEALRG